MAAVMPAGPVRADAPGDRVSAQRAVPACAQGRLSCTEQRLSACKKLNIGL